MSEPVETRRASLTDLDALLDNVRAGFDSYVEFAPDGWQPPSLGRDRESTADFLGDSETWALLALAGGQPVGHVAFFPAREPARHRRHWRERRKIPGLVHLWQLFVLPEWWGRGVAATLHDAAVAEMARRGFDTARLYTPSSHTRARRFYERRGWSAHGEQWSDELRLVLTEYRRAVARPEPGTGT